MRRISPIILERARELRQPQTPTEQRLWGYLRNKQLDGYKFRRQHPIGPFIVDFYCAQACLVIEIDGSSHIGREEYDAMRTTWLNDQGYTVIRFANQEVKRHLDSVLQAILTYCASIPSPYKGEG